MANALRRRAPARRAGVAAGVEVVSVSGTYNIDLKITVEWAREMPITEIEAPLVAFLGEPRGTREIGAFLSGYLRETDDELLPGKVSKYRIAPKSLRALLDVLEMRGAIARESGTTGGSDSSAVHWRAAAPAV